ncbi:hypothetical protein RYX36_032806, partial [Vicia faba]
HDTPSAYRSGPPPQVLPPATARTRYLFHLRRIFPAFSSPLRDCSDINIILYFALRFWRKILDSRTDQHQRRLRFRVSRLSFSTVFSDLSCSVVKR